MTYQIYWTTKEPSEIIGGLGTSFDESEVDAIVAALNLRYPHLHFWKQPENDDEIVQGFPRDWMDEIIKTINDETLHD